MKLTDAEYDRQWIEFLQGAEERAARRDDFKLAAYLRNMRLSVTRRMQEKAHEQALARN